MANLKKIFAVACVGTAIPNLDLFSINIALPKIAAEFKDVPLEDLSWVLNGYAIAYAALLVFFGRLAEGYRRDRSFILGVGIFTLAAAASATASNVWELVAYRVLAAAGAALMTPTSIGLILATFPPERRGAAVRNWAGIGGLAAALGPVLGGALVSIDWRWVFVANATLGASSILIGWRHLPNVPGHDVKRPSLLAAFLVTTGIAALIFAIVKINAWGWHSPQVISSMAISLVLLGLFCLHSLKSPNPLVDPALFRIRPYSGAALAMIPYSVSFGAMLFSVAVWGQSAWGWSALQAGLAIIPGPLMVPLTSSLLTGRLIERGGAVYPVTLGTALIMMGFSIWASFIGTEPNTALIVMGMTCNGIGVGLIFPALMGTATQALPPDAFATGSGAINMLRQASIAIGVAMFVAIVGSPASLQARLEAFQFGWWLLAAVTSLTLLPTFKFLNSRKS
ncbi:MAG: MFS transporter [Limnohabitans sp.]|jgi:EmrB/QacA subfamily drug resistance transporter